MLVTGRDKTRGDAVVAGIRADGGAAEFLPSDLAGTPDSLRAVGSPFVGLYSASKAAAEQLARSWAAEFGPRGVRVNAIAPGVVRTPINDGDGAVLDALVAGTPAGRTGTPEDIAGSVAWVVSADADFVHGAVPAIDGGVSGTRS